VLACPDCGGRLRLLATIEDRAVVEKILTHLGLPVDLPQSAAARTPEWLPGVLGPTASSYTTPAIAAAKRSGAGSSLMASGDP